MLNFFLNIACKMSFLPKFDHQKRYLPISQFYREKFGFRVQKVSVSIAKTCPNREGLAGMKTCIFCDEWGSAPAFVQADWPMLDQLTYHKERIRKRYKANKFLIYSKLHKPIWTTFRPKETVCRCPSTRKYCRYRYWYPS